MVYILVSIALFHNPIAGVFLDRNSAERYKERLEKQEPESVFDIQAWEPGIYNE